MANGGKIEFDVGFNVELSSLQKAVQELKSIQTMVPEDIVGSANTEKVAADLQKAKVAAQQLGDAFDVSFNKDLGVLNISKFEQQLKSSGTTLSALGRQLEGAGGVGSASFKKITTEILTTNTYVKQTDQWISKIATTLGNTLKWNIASGAINKMSGSIQEAWGFTKALDGSLNDIQIVTGKSAEQMDKLAEKANKVAGALGTTTKSYTDAALTFYQQGLGDEDVAARAETSLKVSNVTGLSGDQSAEYVTSVLNGYKVAAEDAENAMDKLAAVGAATASSLAELAEGMSKVASSANAMGVSEDQLAATLSTVISVTRQDAASVGTAFKTIYARISDIKAGTADAEVTLGNYTKKMAEMGFNVLDSTGQMRDLGEVIEEIGGKWKDLSKEQQISLAQTMAGTRQYNNLIALFDNWAEYENALNVSMEANGTLQKQQETYAESLQAKLNELTAAKEKLFMAFVDNDGIKDMLDGLTLIVDKIGTVIDAIGGGKVILEELGIIALRVFNKQITNSVINLIKNIKGLQQNVENASAKLKIIEDLKQNGIKSGAINSLIEEIETATPLLSTMTAEQQNQTMEIMKQKAELESLAEEWEEDAKAAQDYIKTASGAYGGQSVELSTEKYNQTDNVKAKNQIKRNFNEANKNIESDKDKRVEIQEKLNRLYEEELEYQTDLITGEAEYTEEELDRAEIRQKELNSLKKELDTILITSKSWEGLKLIPEGETKKQIELLQQELKEVEFIDPDEYERIYEELKEAVRKGLEEGAAQADLSGEVLGQNVDEDAALAASRRQQGEQAGEVLKDTFNEQKIAARIQQIGDIAQKLMQVRMAIQQIKQLGSIWSDEDLSLGEKLLSTLTSLSMILPGVADGINLINKTSAGHAVLGKLTSSFKGLITVIKGSAVVAGVAAVAIAALAGVLIGVGIAIAARLKANKEAAKEAQAAADAEHKQTEALREQKDAIDSIVSGYEELYSQYKNGKISLEELRQKTYDLCMQYGEQDLALKALIADQETLNQLMEEAQDNADSALMEQSGKEADQTKDAIKRGIMADAKTREDKKGGASTIDLKGMTVRNSSENDFADALKAVGIDFKNNDHINTDSLVNAYTENYDELMEVLSKYSDLDAAAQIGGYLDNQKENLDRYKEAVDTEAQLYLENELKSKYDPNKGFAEGQNYHTATTESAKSATEEKFGERTDENAEDWDAYYNERLEAAKEFYAQYEELSNQAMAEEINNALEASGTLTDNMNLSQKQLEYLYLHLDTAEAYTHLEDFFNDYEKDIQIANSKTILLDLDAQLSDSDKEAFTDEELASYFGLDGFEEQIGMSIEQLKGIDFNDQKIALLGATQKMKSELLDSYTEAMKSNEESFQAVDDKLNDSTIRHNSFLKNRYENFVDEVGAAPQEALNQIEAYNQEIEKIESKYYNNELSYDDYNTEVENLKKEYDAIDNLIDKYEDLDTAKAVISDAGDEDHYSYLEVEQELQDLQAQGLDLSEIDTTQDLNAQQAALQENIANSKAEMESLKQEIISMNEAAANSAQSLRDLNDLKAQGAFQDIEGTTEDEGKAAFNKKANELYEASRMEGLDSEELRDYSHYLKEASENSEILSDDLKDNLEDCQDLAVQIKRMNKGVESLEKNWKNWSDILKKSSKESEEYADAMMGSKSAMADLLDVTDEFISNDLITNNMEDIAKAAEGDADAIDRLRVAMLEDVVLHMDLDDDALEGQTLLDRVQEIQSMLDMNSLEVGAEVNDEGFITALNQLIAETGMTTDQVNAMLSGMGFEANFASEDQDIGGTITEKTTHHRVINEIENDGARSWDEVETTEMREVPYEGTAKAFSMSTDGSTPQIKSVTKKAGGGMNNKSSSNPGGKSGGGGGGGKKAEQKKFKDAKTDRYHDVNAALKEINNEMERLESNRENLTGVDLAASYQEELNLLDREINALTHKQKLQKQEADELRNKGRSIQKDGEVIQVKSLSEQGVEFDENGNISNYNEAIVKKTDEINQMIDDYNRLSADKQTDELKKQIEDAEAAYDQFMEDIERYETLTQDEMEETAKEIAAALNKKIELKIEKFSMTIDLKLETREAENQLEDFKSKMNKKDKTAAGRTETAAKKFENYMDPKTGVQSEIDRVNKIREDIEKMQNGGHSDVYSEYDEESGTWVDNTAKAQEDLKKYTEQMMSDMEDMESLMDEINQGLLDTFDEIQDGFDEQIAGYDAVADHIDHNISLIEKLYGDNSADKLGEWYDAQYQNSLGKVDMLKKEADFWQKQMEDAETDDAYKKAKENWMNSMNELNAAVEDSLDTVIASYENSIDVAFDKLNSSLTGGKGLEYTGEEWELMNQNADRYLDTINATYEVQKLQRKFQQSINDTDSLSAQKKLNDLMQEEITALEKKDKLSQYDIDRANLKYEIALKQIALEEAQQNKSTLRLKRDSQGNYSYQYAGDEDSVASKQQEISDAQNQLYNLDKDAYRQNLDDMYSIYSEFQDKMKEVAKKYGTDSEEYEKYRVLYEKEYGDMINGILADNETIKTNLMSSSYDALKDMYETDSESFSVMTDTNMESFDEMTKDIVEKQLPSIVSGNQTSIEDMISKMKDEGGFGPTMTGVWGDIQTAANTYQKRIQDISKASGQDLQNLKANNDYVLHTLQGWVDKNDNIISNADASKEAYDKIAEGVKALADQYNDTKKNAEDAATKSIDLQKNLNENTWKELEAQKALDNLIAKLKEWNDIEPKPKTFVTNHVENNSGGGGGGGSSSGGGGSSGGGSSPSGSTSAKTKRYYVYGYASTCAKTKTKLDGPLSYTPNTSKYPAWKKAEVRNFKSGGYTGTWANGSDEANGRLALLHQKELVLNESDTSNFLETIRELKSGLNFENLTEAISSQLVEVKQIDLSFQNQIVRQLDRILASVDTIRNSLEQNVNINAEFKDVRSSQMIIDAMDQLTNRASQMAFNIHRKR